MFASLDDNNYLEIFTILLIRLSISLLLFHALGYWFYMLYPKRKMEPGQYYSFNYPKVSILIPVKDEPDYLLKRMINSLNSIDYPSFNALIINNGRMEFSKDVSELIGEFSTKIKVIRKPDSKGYKAGALNYGLSHLENDIDYILVLDIDHAPEENILKILVKQMKQNNGISFVQAPQRYEGLGNEFLSKAYCYKQRIFYDYILRGLSDSNALFMVGTNMLIRREVIDDLGGFDETTLTEDIKTSFLLHQRGNRGIYVDDTVATGYTPVDYASYIKQQRRWAIGTFQNFFTVLKEFFKAPNSLYPEQWLLYLGFNGTFYFQGVTNILLTWSSILLVFFHFDSGTNTFEIIIFMIIIITIVYQMILEHNHYKTSYKDILLSFVLFFNDSIIYFQAIMDLILKRNIVFQVTEKSPLKCRKIPIEIYLYHIIYILVTILVLIFSLISGNLIFRTVFWMLFFFTVSIINLFIFVFYLNNKLKGNNMKKRVFTKIVQIIKDFFLSFVNFFNHVEFGRNLVANILGGIIVAIIGYILLSLILATPQNINADASSAPDSLETKYGKYSRLWEFSLQPEVTIFGKQNVQLGSYLHIEVIPDYESIDLSNYIGIKYLIKSSIELFEISEFNIFTHGNNLQYTCRKSPLIANIYWKEDTMYFNDFYLTTWSEGSYYYQSLNNPEKYKKIDLSKVTAFGWDVKTDESTIDNRIWIDYIRFIDNKNNEVLIDEFDNNGSNNFSFNSKNCRWKCTWQGYKIR